MKLDNGKEICDKCKDRIGNYRCFSCKCFLCDSCSDLMRFEMSTRKFDGKLRTGKSNMTYAFSQLYSPNEDTKKIINTTEWSICQDCKKALNKKDPIKEIIESPEMIALLEKIQKTIGASKILIGLDDEDNKTERLPHITLQPQGGFISPASSISKSVYGSLIRKKYKK